MKITVQADYSQVCVFDPTLKQPFNDWNNTHQRQGFSWRSGSVSFGVPEDQYEWEIDLELKPFSKNENLSYIRIISVPLEVDNNGLEIGGVMVSEIYDIPQGLYLLTFAIYTINSSYGGSINLEAVRDTPKPKIILPDEDLDPPEPLLMEASPA